MLRSVFYALLVSCSLLGCGLEQKSSIAGNSSARHLLLSCKSDGDYRAIVRLVKDDWKYFLGYDRRHEDTFALIYKFPSALDSLYGMQSRELASKVDLEMVLGDQFQDLRLSLNPTLLESNCKTQITETDFKFKCDNSDIYTLLNIIRADRTAVYSYRPRHSGEEGSSHSMYCKAIDQNIFATTLQSLSI